MKNWTHRVFQRLFELRAPSPWTKRFLRPIGLAVFGGAATAALLVGACDRPELQSEVQAETDWSEMTLRRVNELSERLAPSRSPTGLGAPTGLQIPSGAARAQLERDVEACRASIDEARNEYPLPGAPKLEENRAMVLARGKAEPVLFLRAPEFTGEVTRGMKAHRQRIMQTLFPRDVVLQLISQFRHYPEHLRTLLLREGYFYTDDAAVARETTVRVSFEDLFTQPRLRLARGSQEFALKRKEGLYYYADGPYQGERARLLLFDRVWVEGQDPGRPLHVDVRELALREGFEQMRVDYIGQQHLVTELKFADQWVPALLERDGTRLSLDCLVVEPDDFARVGRARDEGALRSAVLHSLRHSIAQQVKVGLPFDEPRTEVGQQDGKLRRQWERAYFAGRTKYKFNGDSYRVFDEQGRPMTPQVCIDFITETLEKASGMRWTPKGRTPRKIRGALDFDDILEGRRRQEFALRNYARENPHQFELIDVPMGDWVRYERVPQFFRFVKRYKDTIRTGDVVIIRGRAEWDNFEAVHTHTFFVYESDPITGMPMLLAGNSGKPRIVTWDGEMLRAPKRSIRHVLRLNTDWLYDNLVIKQPSIDERWAPPLTVIER